MPGPWSQDCYLITNKERSFTIQLATMLPQHGSIASQRGGCTYLHRHAVSKIPTCQTLDAISHGAQKSWVQRSPPFSVRHFERKNQEDNFMTKVFRFVAMCAIGIALATFSTG